MKLPLALTSYQPAYSLSLTVDPGPGIDIAVWPVERSPAVLLVLDVVAFVTLSVRPLKDALSVHHVVAPAARVNPAIAPLLDSCSNRQIAIILNRVEMLG